MTYQHTPAEVEIARIAREQAIRQATEDRLTMWRTTRAVAGWLWTVAWTVVVVVAVYLWASGIPGVDVAAMSATVQGALGWR